MFSELNAYKYIIVVGPHRSGTTILAKMIANDTGKKFYDESVIQNKYVDRIPALKRKDGFVLQAPWALPWAPVLSDRKTLIVLAKRDETEIMRSRHKAVNNKGKGVSKPPFTPEQAYSLWNRIKYFTDEYLEIEYSSLKDHPLWIDYEERHKGFWHHKQTKL